MKFNTDVTAVVRRREISLPVGGVKYGALFGWTDYAERVESAGYTSRNIWIFAVFTNSRKNTNAPRQKGNHIHSLKSTRSDSRKFVFVQNESYTSADIYKCNAGIFQLSIRVLCKVLMFSGLILTPSHIIIIFYFL